MHFKLKTKKEDPNCEKKPRTYARYYDTPDGCDVKSKVMVASRYGVVAGLIMGTYDVLMFSHVMGMGPMLKRYARHVVPLGLMGATFALVSNLVLRYRNIDDKLNYFLGGLACGPLVALHLRSGHGLVAGGILLGLVGVIKKEAVDQEYELLHKFPNHMNTITGCRKDYTLTTDPRDGSVFLRHLEKRLLLDKDLPQVSPQQPVLPASNPPAIRDPYQVIGPLCERDSNAASSVMRFSHKLVILYENPSSAEMLESCDNDKDDKQKPKGKRKQNKQEPGTC